MSSTTTSCLSSTTCTMAKSMLSTRTRSTLCGRGHEFATAGVPTLCPRCAQAVPQVRRCTALRVWTRALELMPCGGGPKTLTTPTRSSIALDVAVSLLQATLSCPETTAPTLTTRWPPRTFALSGRSLRLSLRCSLHIGFSGGVQCSNFYHVCSSQVAIIKAGIIFKPVQTKHLVLL
jgi:hypothetical protein